MPVVKVPSLTWSRAMKVSAATAVLAAVISAVAAMRARMVWRAMAATSVWVEVGVCQRLAGKRSVVAWATLATAQVVPSHARQRLHQNNEL